MRVGAEGVVGGDGRNREDILKEKPHIVNTDSVSVSYHVYRLINSLYPLNQK